MLALNTNLLIIHKEMEIKQQQQHHKIMIFTYKEVFKYILIFVEFKIIKKQKQINK
jgi:hypothetical protein